MSVDTIKPTTNGTNDQSISSQTITLVADSTVPAFEFQNNNTVALSRSIVTMTDETVKRVKLLAQMMEASSFNSSRNPMKQGDYFIIMLKGLAVGLDPIIAVDFISVIQGKPVIDGKGLLALILNAKRSGEVEDIIIDSQEDYCSVTIKRKGMTPHTERFTLDDARRMKTTEWKDGAKKTIPLAEKDNWVQQPRTMLKWRAVAACARVCCADIIGGLYSKEEIADGVIEVLEDGTMNLLSPSSAPTPKREQKPTNITPLPQSANGTAQKPQNTATAPAPTFSNGETPPIEIDPLSVQPTPPPTSSEPDPNDPEDIRHAIPVYGKDHWYVNHYLDFVKLLRSVVPKQDTMLNHEVSSEGLRLIGKPVWKDFPSGASAISALKAKLGIPDTPPASKPTSAPPPVATPPPAVAPVPTVAPPQTYDTSLWQDEFDEFIYANFDMRNTAEWEAKAGKKLNTYPSLEAIQADARAIAMRDEWDILVDEAKYFNLGRNAYIEFNGILNIRMYGRSSTFKKQVGDAYYAENKIEGWENGGVYKIGLLRVSWKRNEAGTLIAHTVKVVEDESPDITPDELGVTAEELEAMAKMEI